MRLFASVSAALLLCSSAADAQSRTEPSLAFTIAGGMSAGGRLWTVDNQPLTAPGGPPPQYDTVGVGRRVRPGITGSLGLSYYRSPHWGLNAEIAFFGLGTEQRCVAPAQGYLPDSDNFNQQACTTANGLHEASSLIAFMIGTTYRFLDQAKVQPYVRANAGLALLGNSFVETVGLVQLSTCPTSDNICPFHIISERKRAAASWVVSLAGGFAYYLSPGYRIRMEGRDLIMTLPVVSGPATITATGNFADTRMTLKHRPVFMIGLDVLLERRHTRRY